MKKCNHCNRVTDDPKQQYCFGCGGVEFTVFDEASAVIVPAASTPKAAIVPTVSAPKVEAPRRQVEEKETKDPWFTSVPALILWWIVICFIAYVLWIYAMPIFWGWAKISWHSLWGLLEGWLIGSWWATPWGFPQVLLIVLFGAVVLLVWLISAIPVIFVLAVTLAAVGPILYLLFELYA